jgi:hypothetical protein
MSANAAVLTDSKATVVLKTFEGIEEVALGDEHGHQRQRACHAACGTDSNEATDSLSCSCSLWRDEVEVRGE